MTKFTIEPDVFVRLANASYTHGSSLWQDFQCVRFEYFEHKIFAVACNRHILAVEYLGETTEQNAAVNITNNPVLLAWCKTAGQLTIETWPGVELAIVQIDGITYNGPTFVKNNEDRFVNWWKLIPVQLPRVDKGFLFMETELLCKLGAASPSGMLSFPEVIDNTKVCIVRDVGNANWIGVFLPNYKHDNARPATIPTWVPV